MRTETFEGQEGAPGDVASRTGLTTVTTEVTTMTMRIAGVAVAALLMGAPAWAQDPRVEISGNAGWTFSDGVSSDTGILAGNGALYNRVDPKDSFSWNATIGFFFTENWEIEFLYGQQQSKLVFGGTTETEVGDFKIKNYHGVFSYNAGDANSKARPFVFFGAGVTDYPGLSFTRLNGQTAEIGGNSKFSGTFGLGVKAYPSKNVGLRVQARWTPTYIKTDSDGYWCDPYWGCYVVGNAQYSNQFEFTGGLTLRF
jgi:outer membrane protein W